MTYDSSTINSSRPLYRSTRNKLIAGVCRGIADYFNIDPIVVRLAWVGLILWGGIGIIAYIAAILLIPSDVRRTFVISSLDGKLLLGLMFITVGLLWVLSDYQLQLGYYFFPTALIVTGIILLYRKDSIDDSPSNEAVSDGKNHKIGWSRPENDRIIFGVCGGLGRYVNVDPNIIRVIWGVMTASYITVGVAAYLLLYIIMPKERSSSL